jgi:CRISPR-associated protein Csm3
MKLISKYKIKGTIKLLSGLHIGDSKENAEIGGVDSPVIRRKDNKQPYIPGSSLKGKMRCLLEQKEGASEVGNGSELLNSLFGITEKRKGGKVIRYAKLSRLIVRDADMNSDSVEVFSNIETDMPFTEIKFENTIDRVKGAASNGGLRQIERVPAGAIFDVEFIFNLYEGDNKDALLELFKDAQILLENDYLGGSGTRGYGNIEMNLDNPVQVYPNA